MNQEIAGHMGSVKALDLAVRKKKFPLKFYWPECSCLLWRQTSFSLMSTWHRVKKWINVFTSQGQSFYYYV